MREDYGAKTMARPPLVPTPRRAVGLRVGWRMSASNSLLGSAGCGQPVGPRQRERWRVFAAAVHAYGPLRASGSARQTGRDQSSSSSDAPLKRLEPRATAPVAEQP